MNFPLNHLPERDRKPRESGITMVMDKGLSVREAEDFASISEPYTDLIKLGFGTALITKNLEKKLAVYREAGLTVYFGGTLFEAFIARKQFDDFLRFLSKFKMECTEVSDGSIILPHDEKCDYIEKLSKHVRVISEVGSKEEGIIIHPNKWIEMMNKEMESGAWKVIAEARESGTAGIFRPSGKAHVTLISRILNKVPKEKIIWEAPQKSQQAWFIKLLGANVNLGNIAPNEVLSLEALRLGLRGDTFFHFMSQNGTSVAAEL